VADPKVPEDWAALLRELDERRAAATAMGGSEKLERRRQTGRLDARERIARLCDPGSFREIGALAGGVSRGGLPLAPADALVGGLAAIDGRPAVVFAEDFTVMGGSIGLGNHAKRVRLAKLALQERAPLVMLLEGAGERATNVLERYPHAPNDLQVLAKLSGRVPTVALVLGPSAGHGALCGLLADFVVMVRGAALFSAGPPLVAAALGETVTAEDLGGAEMHTVVSGVAHNLAETEDDAFALVRDYLGYLPSSAWSRPPALDASQGDGERRLDELLEWIPRNVNRPYDMRRVVAALADHGRVLEIQPLYGESILSCLARLGGESIAVLANQPAVRAGAIDREAADKAAHFLELADAYHLPVVFLADNPGIMAGSSAERRGTLRAAARMYAAQSRLRGPKLHVTLRKAFGFGSSLMAMNPFDGQTLTLAFPTLSLGALPARSGGAAAKLDAAAIERLGAAESAAAWSAADGMSYDDVIDPRELRNALLAGLRATRGRRAEAPGPAAHAGIRP
jgi:acetyl-CoA carboxylase carboxyltransferase component